MSLLVWLALAAATDFEDAEREAIVLPPEEGIARLEMWQASHPGDADVPRALLWEAQRRVTQGRLDDARTLLTRALAARPGDELRFDLALSLADLLALEGRHAEAAQAYQALGAPPGSRWAQQATLRTEAMQGAVARGWAARVLLGLSALLLLVRAGRLRAALWPPPEELTWGAPVLGLLLLAGLGRPGGERTAVVLVALGGAALLWLTGAALRQRPPGGRRLLEAGLAVFLVGSLLFGAIVAGDLWARVADTFAAGAE